MSVLQRQGLQKTVLKRQGTVVRHSSEKGAIIILATFFFNLNSHFNLYNDVFEEKNDFEGKMGKIGILRSFPAKMDFSCFLVLKTGKLSNFTLDKFFVPLVSVGVQNVFMKLQD
jgi:hypothetical protein